MTLYFPIDVSTISHFCWSGSGSDSLSIVVRGRPRSFPTPSGFMLSGVSVEEVFASDYDQDIVESKQWNNFTFRFLSVSHCSVFHDLLCRHYMPLGDVPLSVLDRFCICGHYNVRSLSQAGRLRDSALRHCWELRFVNSFVGACLSVANFQWHFFHHDTHGATSDGGEVAVVTSVNVERWVRDVSASLLFCFGGGQRAYVVGEMYGVLPDSRGEFMRSRAVSGLVTNVGVDHFAGFRSRVVDAEDMGMSLEVL